MRPSRQRTRQVGKGGEVNIIQKAIRYDRDIDLLNRQVEAFSELAGTNKKLYDSLWNELNNVMKEGFRLAVWISDTNKQLRVWKNVARQSHREYKILQKMLTKQVRIPARLRFHYGAARVEVLTGKPITWCRWEEGQFTLTGISKCNPKDTYNWKTGVIVAIENTTRMYLLKDARKELFESMFKKYPELRNYK